MAVPRSLIDALLKSVLVTPLMRNLHTLQSNMCMTPAHPLRESVHLSRPPAAASTTPTALPSR